MADTVDIKYKFERWMSQQGESAIYIGDGLYSRGAVCDQADAFRAGVEIGRAAALASRPAEVDDEGLSSNSTEIEGIAQSSGNSGELPGWKLVPVELSEDMLIAFAEVWYSKKRCIDDCEMADCYAAMLAAAPDHFTDVGNMVSDNARMSFIEKNAIRGSTYKGITSANVILYEIEWQELGMRRAIDAAMSRSSHTTNKDGA